LIKNIDYYRSIHNATGCKTRKEMEVCAIHKRLKRDFDKTLDVETYENFLTGETIDLNINKQTKSEVSGYQKEFTSLITVPVQHGDTFYNESEGLYWICTEVMCKSGLYYDGKLTRCNNILKWQDENKHIFEYPVFDINSTQYNSGEFGDKTMTLGSSQHFLTVVADENTIALNHGHRFFWDRNTVDPTVFKLTQNDTTAVNYDRGIVKLTVTEDQYNPKTDSIENWLCDYFKVSTVTITYSGNPTIRVGGTKTLNVDITETVTWSVESDVGATIIPNGNSVKVRCPNDMSFVDKTITVKATVGSDVGECILTITGGV
jgi:hypothetical protein